MACIICKVDKLSKEFPSVTVSEDCNHPPLACLRCVVSHVEKNKSCPHPNCEQRVDPGCETVQWFKAILNEMFKEYKATVTPLYSLGSGNDVIHVTVLNGESATIPYSSNMTVANLKDHIHIKLKVSTDKQKLLFEGKELPAYLPNGQNSKLGELDVKPNSTIYLVILLYAIPDAFEDVVFDLHWGYPYKRRRDYLDASCLIYDGMSFCSVVDYSSTRFQGIHHSGDIMNDHLRQGHHIINVNLKQIPSKVTHLFFTLSAWNSPDISRYPNPSLRFYEAKNKNKDLCKTTFTHARHSQAVVMCSVSRSTNGKWQIFESGKLSAGNAYNYSSLQKTVKELIKSGF
ncbi:hypothetical protein FSP39_023439 [Pinctada imbricata]|uniref:Ubiquitin-like domain-containing protein n=1 Tax=Pinctada imbricata TaxID=66713 RepID=A0AA89BQR0_PINIB|nr:hypothetical protein FSP39_023439 [Pinctada imbricata]